jgi:dTDP-4-dehydrorhamnose reductase
MKILLTGANGQVGFELWRSLQYLGEVIPTTRNGIAINGLPTIALNLADNQDIEKKLNAIQPDLVVNAAAYTAVDDAETHSEIAQKINTDAPSILSKYAVISDTRLIHYSTDYVFSGDSQTPWKEQDICLPQGVYAQTKLAGEQAIIDSGCQHMIFRTAWIYSQRGNNFMNTMLKLAQEKTEINVVDDQIGSPTWAASIAMVTALTLRNPIDGLYHLTASGKTSWSGFARRILSQAEKLSLINSAPIINGITTSQYPTPAKRTSYSVLDCSKLRNEFDIKMPNWQTTLQLCMQTMRKNN